MPYVAARPVPNFAGLEAVIRDVDKRLDYYSFPAEGHLIWGGHLNGRHPGWYGQLSVRGWPLRASRLAYAVAYGGIPEGLQVLHKCHVSACINPLHLKVGTASENCQDTARSGHHPNQRCGHDLTDENNVLYVRESKRSNIKRSCRLCLVRTKEEYEHQQAP